MMKMPWRKNAKQSSPTRSATNPPVDHYSSSNIACRDNGTTTPPTKTTVPYQNGDSTVTTITNVATTATTTTASVASSPATLLLGSGHYSPVDGSVQQFESSIAITKTDAPQPVVVFITSDDSNSAVVASSNTRIVLATASDSTLLQPTKLLFEQRSSSVDADDDYDIYHTPLQSSMTSLEESHSASNGGGGSHEISSVTTKTVPLKVAESTLTEDTSDATVEEEKDDTLLQTGDSNDNSPTAFVLSSPPPPPPNLLKSPKFLRHASSFLRVSDLIGLDPTMDLSEHSNKSIPNYHCCSDVPPPGVAHNSMEKWVALDDGCGTGLSSSYTPIAQFAVDALATTALATIFDATMWVPDSKTTKIIESKPCTSWEATTFSTASSPPLPTAKNDGGTTTTTTTTTDTKLDDHILIWSGNFRHGLYGSDIPAIRSAAVIYMSATQLLHLLMDSNRVKEYNTMSLGRTDLLTLPCRHIVTKVMRSESRPPLLRKTLQFTSIFHARKLNEMEDGNNHENESYLLVTRAVENPTGTPGGNPNNNSGVVVSEILLGVNVIRTIPHHPQACLLLSVNHVRSPLVPSLFLAKRVGLQAATNFVHDLRKCC